jgi:hypothetical protein
VPVRLVDVSHSSGPRRCSATGAGRGTRPRGSTSVNDGPPPDNYTLPFGFGSEYGLKSDASVRSKNRRTQGERRARLRSTGKENAACEMLP